MKFEKLGDKFYEYTKGPTSDKVNLTIIYILKYSLVYNECYASFKFNNIQL